MKVYFIGCGGIGVSALMRFFAAQGWEVSGSDVQGGVVVEGLRKEGMRIHIGHKAGNVPKDTALVVYSQAIRPENPERQRAEKLGLPILSYPQAVGRVAQNYETIAVAGAHGKSTTTSMAFLALSAAKRDPTVIVGTRLRELKGSNFHIGRSKYLVLEADEFGRAFHNYSPAVIIVTNIDREHLDVFGNLAGVKKAFMTFFQKTQDGGTLILNRDDKNLYSLKLRIAALARKKHLSTVWYTLKSPHAKKIGRVLSLPGIHNRSNALAVLELGKLLRLPERDTLKALQKFKGVWRRLEHRGEMRISGFKNLVPVYDDYAHHPTEIKATLQALRERYPDRQIICVFQPHQAKRLQALFGEFTHAFGGADMLVLLPFYKVVGRDYPDKRFTSQVLAQQIDKKYMDKKVFFLDDPRRLKSFFQKIGQIRDLGLQPAVIVMMGAGDIFTHTDSLLQ